jgi:DNA-directed RNA polymerase subunit M/transcription elongation factor TFIIS
MGRKNHNKDKDLDELIKVKKENQMLRRQMSKLQKQVSRLSLDEHQHIKELLDSQDKENKELAKHIDKEQLLRRWLCHKCKEDYIKLIILQRVDGMYYFRRCPSCGNKTKLKKYTDSVVGDDSDSKNC